MIGTGTDPVLRRYLAVRLPIAAALLIGGLTVLLVAIVHQADTHRFEQRAAHAPGRVVGIGSRDDPYDYTRVVVEYDPGTGPVKADAPVYDNIAYDVGESVQVLYEAGAPARVRLVGEPYDLGTPAFGASVFLFIALLTAVRSVWWVKRVRKLAASDAPAFAMTGRRWRTPGSDFDGGSLGLYPLDATPEQLPVGTVKLMAGASQGLDAVFPVLVRGVVAEGSTVVVKTEDRILWPRGRLRAGSRLGRIGGRGSSKIRGERWIKPGMPLRLGEGEPRWWLFAPLAIIACTLGGIVGAIPLMATSDPSAWLALGPLAGVTLGVVTAARTARRPVGEVDGTGLVIKNLAGTERVSWDGVVEIAEGAAPVISRLTRGGHAVSGLWVSVHGRQRAVFCWGTASPKPWVVRAFAEAVRPWAEPKGVVVKLEDASSSGRDTMPRWEWWLWRKRR